MTQHLSRRRVIRISGAAAGLVALGSGVRALAPAAAFHTWRGEALGAPAEIALWSGNANVARATLRRIAAELARLESVFSLYDRDSEISRLNRDGGLDRASQDMHALVASSLRLGEASGGAFDITVQPLWRVYESHFWSKTDVAPDIAQRALDTARALVDYRAVEMEGRRIGFARAGMAITLNGVAQGYATDVVADLLRNEGYETAFVDLGEARALGAHPDGRPWRVGLASPARRDAIAADLDLTDAALAVSGSYGTTFEPSGRFHHIFDPATGASAAALRDAAVIGPRATLADGLSTAICVAGEGRAQALLASFPGYRALVTANDGARRVFGA